MSLAKKTVSLEEIYTKGLAVFEDKAVFEEWLNKNVLNLQLQKPKNLLEDATGRKQVMNVLNAVLYGIYL